MANPPSVPSWRPKTADVPKAPGVYRFMDGEGRVIYVGKAKNLRSRLVSYFAPPETLHHKTALLVSEARAVQWTMVQNEVEALTLEYQWIKQFNPRYNIVFRDDKSYPYLSVSMGEDIPRVAISRDAKKKGNRYFGPYTKVWAIRESIDLLLPTFPIRSCTAGVLRRAQAQGRPCLLGYIDRCSAPCVGRISLEDHRHLAEQLCKFMDGDTGPFMRRLEGEMEEAAEDLDFETAAKKRDQLQALIKVQEKNTVALPVDVNADVFAMAIDELDVSVQAFFVRAGRIRGTRGWVVERVDERTDADLMHDFLEQVYADRLTGVTRKVMDPVSVDDVAHMPVDALPPEVLTSVTPASAGALRQVLEQARGFKVSVRVPMRGQKKALLDTVMENAQDALRQHKTKRAGDLTHRALALEDLMASLDLPSAPLRIECFDVSHTQGTNRVASMVVFEDGIPRKDSYRLFNVRGDNPEGKKDDTAAMREVLGRRFKKRSEPLQPVETGQVDGKTPLPQKFAYEPSLIVVDGGRPQVNAAKATLEELDVTLPVIGLAERLEEIWFPFDPAPLLLPRSAPALYLLQHLRDESHRFALRAHRAKRSKSQVRSTLDSVAGLGPVRQKALLRKFGSLKRVREASLEDLATVPGIGPKMAAQIKEQLESRVPKQQ